jgi:hypothetical protein
VESAWRIAVSCRTCRLIPLAKRKAKATAWTSCTAATTLWPRELRYEVHVRHWFASSLVVSSALFASSCGNSNGGLAPDRGAVAGALAAARRAQDIARRAVNAYAGRTLGVLYGVRGDGYSSAYVDRYGDDVTLRAGSVTPTPVPSATPHPTPSEPDTARRDRPSGKSHVGERLSRLPRRPHR